MNRLTNPSLHSNQNLLSLIRANLHILAIDQQDHSIQVDIYHRMLAKGDKSAAYLEKMRERLVKAELRLDYTNTLITRLQKRDYINVFLGLEQAISEAKIRESCKTKHPKKYGFMIQFDQSKVDIYLL